MPATVAERIRILATDDEKIKSFGELLTNDSSRRILQLLFNEELTATQIAQKTGISLQLIRYHLAKLQGLEIVRISRTEKNSKSQDMKVYAATEFSIVIVPPSLSERARESKLLVRSFRHIYKVAGLGIAACASGLFSLSTLQPGGVRAPAGGGGSGSGTNSGGSGDGSAPMLESSPGTTVAGRADSVAAGPPAADTGRGSDAREGAAVQPPDRTAEILLDSDAAYSAGDLFVPSLAVTVILGGCAAYYLWRFLRGTSAQGS